MFLKSALKRVGEANLPEAHSADAVRDVLILGIEDQSLELARTLQRNGWQVMLADTDRDHVAGYHGGSLAVHYIPAIDEASMSGLITTRTDAIVTMLADDDANYNALEIAYKEGVTRQVVRPNDLGNSAELGEFGALIVDPTSAMVNLLEQTVRAPQTAAILLHQDSDREMVQITIDNPDVDGQLVRDLRLPETYFFSMSHATATSSCPTGIRASNRAMK